MSQSLVPSTSEPVDALDGVELLYQSAHFFDQALKQFRICHDLCIASDILDKPAVASMDQCAVKFRQISSYCATLSEKVSSVWCGTCGTFYRNLEKIQDKNPAKLMEKISKNGSELAEGFCHLAECARKLSQKFLTVKVGGATIGDEYVQAFKEEEQRVQAIQQTTQKRLVSTRMQTAQLEMEFEHKQRSLYERGKRWLRLTHEHELVQAEFTVRSAKEQEAALQEEVKQLERKLAEQATQTKKAEVVATELKKLMEILNDATEICECVGKHFERDSKSFLEMSSVTTGKQLAEKYQLTVETGRFRADGLVKQKELLEKYHRTMSIISSSYNFQAAVEIAIPNDLKMQSKILEGLGIRLDF